jgi:hypothetical protein
MRRPFVPSVGPGRSRVSPYCLLCGNRTKFYAKIEGAMTMHVIGDLIGREEAIIACGRCRSTSIVQDLAESPGWT